MRRHINSARDLILPIIDFFYPPFRKILNLQTFRYAVSGAANTFIGFAAYLVSYEFILQGKLLNLEVYAFKSHIAALFISFCVSFPLGFFLMKYVVFSDSNMKGRIQLFRYFMVCLFNLALNYLLLKVFVEIFHIYPILAQLLTIIIVVVFSYLAQRHFSFRIKNEEEEITD